LSHIVTLPQDAGLEVEITLSEDEAAQVCARQEVRLKARALPFETLSTRVDRVAPAAAHGERQGNVTVYCRLDHAPAGLLSEMTGHARICTGRRPAGEVLLGRVLRFLRTEFWW